ncbi:unnamed protein product [Brachionus calyciflorus]|uniref:N-terminal kinase-like protein n=1 Tax=Brachionus calyciflorus TaxID=104777 RepID=A0A813M7L8_9BILA|nr:unnamed protein product [Brachionus calyciflorus]
MWGFFSKDPSKDLVNFEIQEQIQLDPLIQERSIWNLNNCKRKSSSVLPVASAQPQQNQDSLYSVFSCHLRQGQENLFQSAKNGFKRTKMLRHPNMLMFQDGVENDKSVFIVTERVQPLLTYLKESKENDAQRLNEISWGLYQIATALNFINSDCKLVHNNVNISSIFVNRAGEWKLFSFEYTHGIQDQSPYKYLTSLDCYTPPEKSPLGGYNSNQNNRPTESGVDSWTLGCLIWEIFNGILPNTNALKNPGQIPKSLVQAYMSLLNPMPEKRLTPAKFISLCRQSGGFMNNHFVDTLLFLEEIQIKDANEKTKFFTELTQKLDDFPGQLCLFKILPQLLQAYEFGNAGSSVLAPLFKLGKLLDEAEYQKKIIPVVVKLFSSTDRTTRMRLLSQLHLFVEHLSASIINDQIFPHICLGFNDSNPAIRESTIRSMVLLAPKLNYNNINVELMKHFARLQAQDDQGMIRTNTTVCIGKIAPYINPQLRQRILLSAFPKSMRDPFPLARLSGIIALANTDRFYTLKDIATKVLPSICCLTVDPEKDVRDEAFKTVKQFLQKLEKVSEQPELALELEKDVQSCNLDLKNETSWTSWAMTSLSSKMTGYKTKNQQPSIALNTQPLGPPPALTTSNKTEEKKEKKEESKPVVAEQETKQIEDRNTGWNFDEDNDWKDLEDDDEQMEPLEPVQVKPNLSTKSTSNASKSDWSEWNNSFEDDSNQLPKASSYNWSSGNQTNEEDVFNNLVKDVKLSDKKETKKGAVSDGWDDWSDNLKDNKDSKKQERSVKQAENRQKQTAGPLKLGQKKSNFDMF